MLVAQNHMVSHPQDIINLPLPRWHSAARIPTPSSGQLSDNHGSATTKPSVQTMLRLSKLLAEETGLIEYCIFIVKFVHERCDSKSTHSDNRTCTRPLGPWQTKAELCSTTVACVAHVVHLEGSQPRWPARIRRNIICVEYVWEGQQPTMREHDARAVNATTLPQVHCTS